MLYLVNHVEKGQFYKRIVGKCLMHGQNKGNALYNSVLIQLSPFISDMTRVLLSED